MKTCVQCLMSYVRDFKMQFCCLWPCIKKQQLSSQCWPNQHCDCLSFHMITIRDHSPAGTRLKDMHFVLGHFLGNCLSSVPTSSCKFASLAFLYTFPLWRSSWALLKLRVSTVITAAWVSQDVSYCRGSPVPWRPEHTHYTISRICIRLRADRGFNATLCCFN